MPTFLGGGTLGSAFSSNPYYDQQQLAMAQYQQMQLEQERLLRQRGYYSEWGDAQQFATPQSAPRRNPVLLLLEP